MNKRILFFLALLPLSLFGQQTTHRYSFDANIKYYADAFDVELAIPKGMVDLNMNTSALIRIRKEYRLAFCGGPVLQSKDKECILMYKSDPLFISDKMAKFNEEGKNLTRKVHGAQHPDAIDPAGNNDNVHRLLMSSELGVIYGYRDEMARPIPGKTFSLDEHISVLPEKTARKWFNADSVFVYDLPVDDPYQGIYNHCTGVVITKKGRTGFALKLYFTDEGKKNEKRYLQSLRKTIWYRDTEWKYDRENNKRAIRKHWDGVSE